MLDRTEKELVRLSHERLKYDKEVGHPGLDIDMQLWLVNKLLEIDEELTEIQAKKVDARIVTDAKHRIMRECDVSERVAYNFIVKKAMTLAITKVQLAEHILSKKTLKDVFDVK